MDENGKNGPEYLDFTNQTPLRSHPTYVTKLMRWELPTIDAALSLSAFHGEN